jgi:polyhydroxyalkanoate synthesis regulator protein
LERLEKARREILEYLEHNLNKLSGNQEELTKEVIEYLAAKNYVIDQKLIRMVNEIIEENYKFVKNFLKSLTDLTVKRLPVPREINRDELRRKLLDRLFNFLYPDGLNLSQRLWKRKEEAKVEFFQVLKQQLSLKRSAVKAAYGIQYRMEKKLGQKFVGLTKEEIKLIEKLRKSAKSMIKGETSKKKWDSILRQYERYIKQRKETGVLHAHRTLLRELTRAVEKASEESVDEAVHWYMYEKQLYNLKRITRTETARILNTAVVESYKDNPFVIGFKWELNPAHKIKDICDKYASTDFGLGRGVFPKEKLPNCPAHPNCMCRVVPVFR